MTSADFGYIQPFRRYSRSKSEVVQNRPKFCMFLAPRLFGGSAPPPNFWTCVIKYTQFPTMWQSFRAIGRGNSENAWRKKRKKKERKKHHEHFISHPVTTVNGRPNKYNTRTRRLSVQYLFHSNTIKYGRIKHQQELAEFVFTNRQVIYTLSK